MSGTSLLDPQARLTSLQGLFAQQKLAELRRRQLAALTSWWMAGARAQPAVTAVEASLARSHALGLLRGIAERDARARLLVLSSLDQSFGRRGRPLAPQHDLAYAT